MESNREKDMRQPDLSEYQEDFINGMRNWQRACTLTSPAIAVVPYQEPAPRGDNVELGSTVSSTLPMAAIFMRNKYIGW